MHDPISYRLATNFHGRLYMNIGWTIKKCYLDQQSIYKVRSANNFTDDLLVISSSRQFCATTQERFYSGGWWLQNPTVFRSGLRV